MHEHLTTVIPGEEAETLVGVIPLDLASGHEREPYAKRNDRMRPRGHLSKAIGKAANMTGPVRSSRPLHGACPRRVTMPSHSDVAPAQGPGPRAPQPHTSDGAGTGSRAKPGNSGRRRLPPRNASKTRTPVIPVTAPRQSWPSPLPRV